VAGPGGEVRVAAVATFGPEWDWILKATPFRLEGATLDRFLTWVEIEGGRSVEFADERLRDEAGRVVLHGSVSGLAMDEVLEAVLPTIGLTSRIVGDRVVIARARGGLR
jgi:hypothetical protein